MIALLESLATFLFFSLLGLAATALLPKSFSAIMRARLAPGAGIGLYLIFALALSRAGLPVKAFVYPLVGTLVAICGAVAILRPVRLSAREWVSLAAPLVVAIVLVGSPLLTYGFHWLSYANDDMTNYALSAERLSDNGYFTPPQPDQMIANRNLQETYWGLVVLGGERAGVDVILASASSAFVHSPFEMFMPVIFTAFLAIVLVSGMLGVPKNGLLVPTLISVAVASSALAAFGVFYQFLGQEFGLAALCTLTAAVFTAEPTNLRDALRSAAVAAIIGCGLVATYPELVPMIVVAAIIYFGLRVRSTAFRLRLVAAGVTIVSAFALLNSYAFAMFLLVLKRIPSGGTKQDSIELFPFYLVPSGLANLWGLQRIAQFYNDPLQSIVIAGGAFLTVAAVIATIVLVLRTDTPAAPVLFVLMSLCAVAAWQVQAFALYKLAMYVQPFLMAVSISGIVMFADALKWKSRYSRVGAVVVLSSVLVGIDLPAQAAYRDASADHFAGPSAGFTEVPSGSRDAILVQVRKLAEHDHNAVVVSDAFSAPLIKIQAGYFNDDSLFFYLTPSLLQPVFGDDSRKTDRVPGRGV